MLFLAIAITFVLAHSLFGASEIAITFDDLPLSASSLPIAEQETITRRLVSALAQRKLPVIGFVNTRKLQVRGRVDGARTALLDHWLDAGFELGNHTFSHPDLHRVGAEAYERDIVAGEAPLRDLLARRGATLRWFRHPFLHTGRTLEVRERITAFLTNRGYAIAPVTIDNGEWIYARAYDLAFAAKKTDVQKKLVASYLDYMTDKVAYFEGQAQKLFERDIRHVLLVHANRLNADAFDALADRLTQRGYRFVSLARALEDPAYRSPDAYTGRAGLSWLDRWALTRGVPKGFFASEPKVPRWVEEVAGIEE